MIEKISLLRRGARQDGVVLEKDFSSHNESQRVITIVFSMKSKLVEWAVSAQII